MRKRKRKHILLHAAETVRKRGRPRKNQVPPNLPQPLPEMVEVIMNGKLTRCERRTTTYYVPVEE